MPENPKAPLRSFNLLPWREQRRRVRRRRAVVMLALGAVAAVLLLAGIELPLRQELRDTRQRVDQLERSISTERRNFEDPGALEEKKARIAALLAEIRRVRRANATIRGWLAGLPARVPDGLRLTALRLERESWELSGVTDEWNRTAELLRQVREMPMVMDVRIDQLQSNPDASQQFRVAGSFSE